MILRLRSYPAWAIHINGRSPVRLPQRADGLIVVPVSAGPINLEADWTTTPDVVFGRSITVFALLFMGMFWRLERTHAQIFVER
jgi:hypothetical protein